MSIKILNKYIQICKVLDLEPTFEGLKKVKLVLK